MKKILSALFVLSFMAQAAMAQSFAIKGKLLDSSTGEALIGASIQAKSGETSVGAMTDLDGNYKISNLKPGTYSLIATYIGYVTLTQRVTISDKDISMNLRLQEDNAILNEVEVVADVAVERETPVAFSAIKESTIRESLAGRDLPLILNETPGVYANSAGGGAGDAEISIRGFSANNVAVMVNGVPVNDMENGRVYWSNWDLGDVTKSIQVQRGLSASKLATPSVGGTMNVITRGFDSKRAVIARQEIGSNNYTKTSLMLSSGQLKGDWNITVFGSRRKGDGWVEGTFDDAYTYFANISKRFGSHTLSLTGLGSPQTHGQRSYHNSLYKLRDFSTEKAKELGATNLYNTTTGEVTGNYGFDYNADYGKLDRFTVSGNDTTHNREKFNSQQNFYHKPQVNLNHFWTISDKLFLSNVVYASIGNGGGSFLSSSSVGNDGHTNFQSIYNKNYTEKLATNILRSSINNHRWYGFISGLDYRMNDNTTISLGVDGRSYKGEHYVEVTDLLGGEYTTTKAIGQAGTSANLDENKRLYKGDQYGNTYDGIVKSIGGFAMAEYKSNVISAFLSGTISQTYYNRLNYSRAKIYNVNGQEVGIAYNRTVLNNGINYTPADYIIVKTIAKPGRPSVDTTLSLNTNSPVLYNTRSYQQVAGEGKLYESDPIKKIGYSVKGGLNYNLNEFNNIFFNAGFISRPPFIDFIFSRSAGEIIPNANNEKVMSFELGYGINHGNFKANLNAYHSTWMDKSSTVSMPRTDGREGNISFNVSGMDARHIGVELELAQSISSKIDLNAAISLGDWRWTSSGIARGFDDDGTELPTFELNAKDVHVGGSAQNQFMLGFRYEPFQGFYIRPTYLMFAKNYANFDPATLKAAVPQDSYRLPTSRNVDLHTGYSFKFYKDYKLSLNGSILNLLNEYYIMNVNTSSTPSDPSTLEAFFNRGRTYTLGASVSF
ncbi:TonB-dependent receptor [Adhaeribacter soli]|uniref:TonB-dependent receptor n=1 Tax=Adhaeribacter soli TaxID=2607655 RepID=A0A5N1J7A8_9BACT|nr:TonB-dependent receptor [Adhaeribacter soli]KAA9340690.1 TonB-dependent receptor [Adhaeribacter soli]